MRPAAVTWSETIASELDLKSAGRPEYRRTDERGPLEIDLPNYADFGNESINDTLAIQFANFLTR